MQPKQPCWVEIRGVRNAEVQCPDLPAFSPPNRQRGNKSGEFWMKQVNHVDPTPGLKALTCDFGAAPAIKKINLQT
jgi:hypothetical protein